MKNTAIYNIMFACAIALTGCTDTLTDETARQGRTDEIGFGLYVSEQADMSISVGGTRSGATADSIVTAARTADHYVSRMMTGDNPCGLKVVRMPLPFVGIHDGAVKSEHTDEAEGNGSTTRAGWNHRVASAETFHDSLTVWGYTRDADTEIFERTLVQRITNWRTSGHWPYGETGLMRFYAVAPSLESTNMVTADANFSTPPTMTYTLPEKGEEMVDLLYGDSGPIDIAAFGTEASHEGKDDKTVDLQFQHILTAIRFAQGKIPSDIRVKQISLKGVNTKGTFYPATTDAATGTAGMWSITAATPGNYTMFADFNVTVSTDTYLNDSVFYMLPHTVTESVILEIVIESKPKYKYSSTGKVEYTSSELEDLAPVKHTLKCSLTGDIWKKGYTVTYLLTIGEVADGYYFVADALAENDHSETSANHNFTLHSYRHYWDYDTGLDVTTHGVNWKVAGYYQDEGCKTPFDGSDASKAPKWLGDGDGVTGNASGTSGIYLGGYNGTASYNLLGQSPVKGGNHKTILEANSAARTDASTWDLSTKNPDGSDKSSETANCYIINRTGNYKFPLVYGNKSSNGNEAEYFVDHTGTRISKQYIKDQITDKNPAADTYENVVENVSRQRTEYTWNTVTGSVPESLRAVLVWEDESGQITGLSTSSSTGHVNYNYIAFTVNKSTPSNAVIALQARKVTKYWKYENSEWVLDTSKGNSSTSGYAGYDVGAWETLWTWHIWMTDEVYANEGTNNSYGSKPNDEMYLNWNGTNHFVDLQNYSGTTNKILPVNLGWVPQSMDFEYYEPRSVYVKLQQTEPATGAAETVVHIVQHAKQPLVRGVGTFYQWGRPTALPGLNWPDNPKTVRTIYRNEADFSDFTLENITHDYDAIAQPTKLFRINDGEYTKWSSNSTSAYWDATKTVYDPCPPGFQLPPMSVFTGFSTNNGETAGSNSSNINRLNMWPDAGETFYGGYFYVAPQTSQVDLLSPSPRYDPTVYMPSTGQYQATKRVGYGIWNSVSPDNTYMETMPCTVWSYEKDDEAVKGKALNLYPDFDREDSKKPAIELPRKVNLSTACAIRPMKTP